MSNLCVPSIDGSETDGLDAASDDVADDASRDVDLDSVSGVNDAADTSEHPDVSDATRELDAINTPDSSDAHGVGDTEDETDAADGRVSDASDSGSGLDATDLPDGSVGPDLNPLGAPCISGTTCSSGFCGNRRCAPDGFSFIPLGTFSMGSPASEVGRFNDETQHPVTLMHAFFLQQTEVTQFQWRTLMGNNPSEFGTCGDECPVERVSWYEALAYANALSDAEGLARCYSLNGCSGTPGYDMECSSVSVNAPAGSPLLCEGYRLPTESEWEYAARAGTTTATYRGDLTEPTHCDSQPSLEQIAWYCENADNTTHDVATRFANEWRIYDMLGNVWEWCWDWYGSYPSTATDPLGVASGSRRVLRGGSWSFFARNARAASRYYLSPGARYSISGFRLARSAP